MKLYKNHLIDEIKNRHSYLLKQFFYIKLRVVNRL